MNKENIKIKRYKPILIENVGQEIYKQIGKRAFFMMGAKNIFKTDNSLYWKIGRNNKGISFIEVIYNKGKDLYDIKFSNIKDKVIKEVKGIYSDQLHSVIEDNTGFRLSL